MAISAKTPRETALREYDHHFWQQESKQGNCARHNVCIDVVTDIATQKQTKLNPEKERQVTVSKSPVNPRRQCLFQQKVLPQCQLQSQRQAMTQALELEAHKPLFNRRTIEFNG